MLWSGSNPTDRILKHLAEIGAGQCSITDDIVVAEPDPEMRQVLLGLLVLHEDLRHASQQRAEAETKLREIAEERAHLLEERNRAVDARDQFLAVAAHELRTPIATLTPCSWITWSRRSPAGPRTRPRRRRRSRS